MILYVIILLMFSLFIFITKYKNSYTWIFVTMIALIDVLFVATIFLYMKTSNYSATFLWEQQLYFALAKFKVNYYAIFDMYTVTVAGYMLVCLCAAVRTMQMKGIKKNAVFIVGMIAPIALFVYLNLYSTGMNIYMGLYSGNKIYGFIADYLNIFNVVIASVYLILPFVFLVRSIFKTKINYRKKYFLSMSIYLATIDVLMLIVFCKIVPCRHVLVYSPDFLRLPSELRTDIYKNSALFLLIIVLFLFLLSVFAVKSKMFDKVDLGRSYKDVRPKSSKIFFKDTRMVFHTCKNTLLSLDFFCKRMEQKNPSPGIQDNIDEMHSLINESLIKLTHLLNIYNDPTEIIDEMNVVECIRKAAKKSNISKDIDVNIKSCCECVYISADSILMEEVFVNLFENAGEAISQCSEDKGKIDIRVLSEEGWVCVYVRDNGCGISRKNYSNVFKPLYSTKKTTQNWGVGLSFVLNVMNSLGGEISIKSRMGRYTEFELLFPATKRNEESSEIFSGVLAGLIK